MLISFLQTSGTNVLILSFNILTGVLLARLLGPVHRGELVAIQTVAGTLIGLALLGLPDAVVYAISREPERTKQTVTTTLWLFIPIVTIGWLLGYLLLPVILQAQSAEVIGLAQIYMFSIVSVTYGSIYVWVFQGLQKFQIWNFLRLFSVVLWFLIIVVGSIFGVLSVPYLVIVFLLLPLPLIPVFMHALWKYLRGPAQPTLKRARQLLRYGLPIMLGAFPQVLNLRLDAMIIAAVLSPEILGYYAVGVTLSGVSNVLFSAIGSTLFPKVARQSDRAEYARVVQVTTRISMLLAGLIVLPQLLLTPFVIPLAFGKDYLPAVPAALLLAVAGIIVGLNTVWRNILNGLGHPKILLYAEIVGLCFTVVLLTLLLQPFQLMGAAFASVLSYFATFCFLTVAIKRYTQVPLAKLIRPTSAEFSIIRNEANKVIRSGYRTAKQHLPARGK